VAGFKIERDLLRTGCRSIAGLDEVGRGALFGPVVAAAIVLPSAWCLRRPPPWARKINDSKLLSPTKRRELGAMLLTEAEALGIGMASSAEIDERNIYWASQMAMKRAVENLSGSVDFLLVDGFALKDVHYRQMGIPQGDRTCMSIAAASIVAKVFRDGLMDAFDVVYGGYGLARNKGYGTEEHFRCLRVLGPTGLHRMSFKLG
jgi:ribonuclease HII